jgi:hypothetical protein
MKEQLMVQSPTFEVNLGGIDLTELQAQELEKAIQQTTMHFLAKLDNGFLKDVYEFTPHPDSISGDPNPQPSKWMDRKWWFGKKLLKLQKDQLLRAEVLRTIAGLDVGQKFQVNQVRL